MRHVIRNESRLIPSYTSGPLCYTFLAHFFLDSCTELEYEIWASKEVCGKLEWDMSCIEWVTAHIKLHIASEALSLTPLLRPIERVEILSLSCIHELSHSTWRIYVEALSLTPLLGLKHRVEILSLSCIHDLPRFTLRIYVEALSLTPLLGPLDRMRILCHSYMMFV